MLRARCPASCPPQQGAGAALPAAGHRLAVAVAGEQEKLGAGTRCLAWLSCERVPVVPGLSHGSAWGERPQAAAVRAGGLGVGGCPAPSVAALCAGSTDPSLNAGRDASGLAAGFGLLRSSQGSFFPLLSWDY